MQGALSSAPAARLVNAGKADEVVYEYRSGRLIKGVLDRDGNFVPELGSRIFAFEDYKYGKDAPRIYNLPGYFHKKGSVEE